MYPVVLAFCVCKSGHFILFLLPVFFTSTYCSCTDIPSSHCHRRIACLVFSTLIVEPLKFQWHYLPISTALSLLASTFTTTSFSFGKTSWKAHTALQTTSMKSRILWRWATRQKWWVDLTCSFCMYLALTHGFCPQIPSPLLPELTSLQLAEINALKQEIVVLKSHERRSKQMLAALYTQLR